MLLTNNVLSVGDIILLLLNNVWNFKNFSNYSLVSIHGICQFIIQYSSNICLVILFLILLVIRQVILQLLSSDSSGVCVCVYVRVCLCVCVCVSLLSTFGV